MYLSIIHIICHQVLLAMRANVEDRGIKGDCTPLMEGASAGHVEIVKLLIAHNADVNAQSSSGNTPLMYACAGGHTDVVKVSWDSFSLGLRVDLANLGKVNFCHFFYFCNLYSSYSRCVSLFFHLLIKLFEFPQNLQIPFSCRSSSSMVPMLRTIMRMATLLWWRRHQLAMWRLPR